MTTRLAVLLASTVLLTACGSAASGGVPGPATGADPTASEPSATAAGFPVVIERRGGIAGFRDRVSVAADGTASVETKRGAQPGCRLEPATVSALTAAVAAIAAAPGTSPSSGVPDAMLVTVRRGSAEPVVVPDEAGEAGAVVVQVLSRATSAGC